MYNTKGTLWIYRRCQRLENTGCYRCPVTILNTLDHLGTKENIDAGQDGKKIVLDQKYILLPLLTSYPSLSKRSKNSLDAGFKPSGEEEKMES
ncbi:hypothetical protein Tco_1498700 [Tanacetum coccineum]